MARLKLRLALSPATEASLTLGAALRLSALTATACAFVLIGHEVGHYLRLFHTSESTGEHDNLADTPEQTTTVNSQRHNP